MPILIILFIGGLLLYAVIPVTIDFVNLQYTGKSTLLQMWGHFILSNKAPEGWQKVQHNQGCPGRAAACLSDGGG